MRTSKIVATAGPATDPPEVLRSLIEAGVDVFRMNASHGSPEERAQRIAAIRTLAQELGRDPAILLDLQGPKIRLGKFEGGGCELASGAAFTITTEEVLGTRERASTVYAEFARDVQPGDPVLLADGALELRVLSTDGTAAKCEVVVGGRISDRKGINLPGVKLSTPSLTRKDKQDLAATLACGIDMVALSFVRQASDVARLRLFLEEKESPLPVISKIEKPEAWDNIDSIIEESDGVMVARGDLGVEVAIEKVPRIQKGIIEKARARGRFIITATQMLESMIENPFPTRAEVSDVANAIYDGTDAVMLSAETSTGKYPVAAVEMMARIALEAERSKREYAAAELPRVKEASFADIVADAAFRAARHAQAAAIAVFTTSGSTARLISRYRPAVPIFAFTPSDAVARQLQVVYGVKPVIAPFVGSTDEMLKQMDELLIARGLQLRDSVVFVAGQPIGIQGTTNLLKLHRVGELR
jgi:pyruvate kinase